VRVRSEWVRNGRFFELMRKEKSFFVCVIICDAWCTVWAGCAHIKCNVCRIFKEIDAVVIVLVLIDVLFIDRRSGVLLLVIYLTIW
jgi:hypothetical protein